MPRLGDGLPVPPDDGRAHPGMPLHSMSSPAMAERVETMVSVSATVLPFVVGLPIGQRYLLSAIVKALIPICEMNFR